MRAMFPIRPIRPVHPTSLLPRSAEIQPTVD